jgi:hypothetical protein
MLVYRSATLAFVSLAFTFATARPLASVTGFDGKFRWVKLSGLSVATIHSLAHAKKILVDISVPIAIKLKKDKGGNYWLTVILADQGADWKWNQTTGHADLPFSGDTIKPGKYTLSIPVAGIPGAVLTDKMQTISLGPGASGVEHPVTFQILDVRGA